MPKVGGKKFSYSKKGKAAAKAYAKRTGKRMTKGKKKSGTAVKRRTARKY
jgi:hypothetical protein|tara:strand:- start:386 stop:535 length:150 start_codon:yes stop_codon:yes gene_type:complete